MFNSITEILGSEILELGEVNNTDFGNLPQLTPDIYKYIQSNKNVKHKKKKDEKPSKIDINSIKTIQKTDTTSGTGVIRLAEIKINNSIISLVSNKKRQEIENMNMHGFKYKKSKLMTDAEKKLYKFLRQRLPSSVIIFSKVRLGDIVELNTVVTRDQKDYYKVACKHVDFAIMSSDLELICIVELDDYTHYTTKAKSRDSFVESVLRECSIPLYRIKCKIDLITKADTEQLENYVYEYIAPICPDCGRPMEVKTSRHRSNYGHRFYGCLGFYEKDEDKKCRKTIDID